MALYFTGEMTDAEKSEQYACSSWLCEAVATHYENACPLCRKHFNAATRPSKQTSRKAAKALNLPRIVDILRKVDSGSYGNASCPHCGAEGRYVVYFQCEDGTERGAMAGCLKLFPQHQIVRRMLTMREKEADYAKKGWTLSGFDAQVNEVLDRVRSGQTSPDAGLRAVRAIDEKRQQWHRNRGGRP